MFPTSIQDSNPASRTLSQKKTSSRFMSRACCIFLVSFHGLIRPVSGKNLFSFEIFSFFPFQIGWFFCVFFHRMNFNGWAENDDNFYVCFSIWRSSSLFYCSKWTWWREIMFLTFSSLGSSLKFALKSISSFLSLCFRHESFPVCHFKGCKGRWMKSWMKCFWI